MAVSGKALTSPGAVDQPRTPQPGQLTEFVGGDPLRGAAALVVLTYHVALGTIVSFGLFGAPGFDAAYGSLASALLTSLPIVALYVFLCLSGFLISRPFVQAFADARPPPNVSRYLRRRALRIVPAFWLVATLVLIRHGTLGQSSIDVVSIYTFTTPFTFDGPILQHFLAPAWTLHVEIGFYLLIPVVAFLLARAVGPWLSPRGRVRLVLGLATLVAAGSLAVVELLPDTVQNFRHLPTNLFAFMPGVALAALEPAARRRLAGRRWVGPVAAAGFLAGLAVFVPFLGAGDLTGAGQRVLLGAGASALVGSALMIEWSDRRQSRLLANPVLDWVGARSYSIYVIHVPVIFEVRRLVPDDAGPSKQLAIALLLSLAAVLPLGALSYRYVERPFMQRRAARRPRALAEAPHPGTP